ncbi:MAG: hypothetical protein RLZZ479_462 [Bacteroidota bacterium]|jgi:hypothetical protein
MLKEIYCRNESDPGYLPGILETGSPYEALLTKIRMIIFTNKGEVLGDPNFGLSLEQMLFEINANERQISESFYGQLGFYVPDTANMPIEIKVSFTQGTVRDICYIDIYIDGKKYLGVEAT